MDRRVVITGMDMITPLSIGKRASWEGMCQSKSGIDYITYFSSKSFNTTIAGEIKQFDFQKLWGAPINLDQLGRQTQFSIIEEKMAIEDSGLDINRLDRSRIGVYLGAGEGIFDFDGFSQLILQSWDDTECNFSKFIPIGKKVLNPIRELEHDSNQPCAYIASLFGLHGPNLNCLTACAASSQAIGQAAALIRRGNADIMVTGGAHSMLHPLGLIGFNLLTALSTENQVPAEASKPFDLRRDGFVIGEGAGILILEELEHAKKRGAHIWGELIGYGTSADAYRTTDSHPEGRGAILAMTRALSDAGISADEIDYINAHGTSTVVNDEVETIAIKHVFGERAYAVPVSSIKSMIGHLIAAAGAVELITCLLAIRDSIVPPTINYQVPDPTCDLDYVPNTARQCSVTTALSNSFGFGGQNVALIVRRFSE